MSFTADIYKEILFDISAGTNQTQPFAMRRTAFNNGIVVVFAINVATKMRSAFLSVTSVISKCKFPHWKGVEIETATLPAYGSDTPFVALFQLPNSADDIFEIVVEDLRRQLKAAKCNADSLPVGTKISAALASITAKQSSPLLWVLKDKDNKDSLAYYSSSDSVDFSKPKEIRVYNNDYSEKRAVNIAR